MLSVTREVPCLSVCGILGARRAGETVEAFVGRLCAGAGGAEPYRPQRVYLGSSFCARSFLRMRERDVADLAALCRARGIPLTLVLPVFSEGTLDEGLARVGRVLEAAGGAIDELTVNDPGMLARWGGGPLAVNLGRLFSKDPRDPRVALAPDAPCRPALLRRSWDGASALGRLRATWPVAGAEFDPVARRLDLSQLPEGLEPAVYGPLCYMSCAQVCEFAGIGVPVERRFRAGAPCAEQCLRAAVEYRGASGVPFLKLGRAVYYRRPDCEVAGVARVRRVLEPLEEVLF